MRQFHFLHSALLITCNHLVMLCVNAVFLKKNSETNQEWNRPVRDSVCSSGWEERLTYIVTIWGRNCGALQGLEELLIHSLDTCHDFIQSDALYVGLTFTLHSYKALSSCTYWGNTNMLLRKRMWICLLSLHSFLVCRFPLPGRSTTYSFRIDF